MCHIHADSLDASSSPLLTAPPYRLIFLKKLSSLFCSVGIISINLAPILLILSSIISTILLIPNNGYFISIILFYFQFYTIYSSLCFLLIQLLSFFFFFTCFPSNYCCLLEKLYYNLFKNPCQIIPS